MKLHVNEPNRNVLFNCTSYLVVWYCILRISAVVLSVIIMSISFQSRSSPRKLPDEEIENEAEKETETEPALAELWKHT